MQLTVKTITRQLPEFKDVCDLMKSSFPRDELISLTLWRILALRNRIHFYAFYDEEILIGIIYTVESENYMYVPFLAVCEKERDKGYGSQILKWAKEYSAKTLVLHIEPLNSSAPNYRQRIRRAAFYHKNGIEDTKYRFEFLGVPFAVYSSDCENFDISIHSELMKWFSFHILKFEFECDAAY